MRVHDLGEGKNPLHKINKFLDDKEKRAEYARELQQKRDAEKDKEKVDEKGLPQKYNPDGETYRGTANKIPNSKSVKKSDITVRGKQVDFPDDSYDATQVSDVEKTDLEQHVKELISTLGKREAMVLKAYFGFEPFEKSYSVNQIGKAMNLSPQRISQILKLARRKLLSRQHSSGKLKSYMYDSVNEDLGSIPPLTDLIVMAVVGQTTVAALKAAYKTGKYALKLKRLADKAGVKLNQAVMGEDVDQEPMSSENYVLASPAGSSYVWLWKNVDGKATPVNQHLTTSEGGKLMKDHGIKWIRYGAQKYFDDLKNVNETWQSNMDKAAKKAHADAAEKRKKMGPVTSDTLADINAKLGNTKPTKKKTDEAIANEGILDDIKTRHRMKSRIKDFELDREDNDKVGLQRPAQDRAERRLRKKLGKSVPSRLSSDQTQNEAVNRDEYAAQLKAKAEDKFMKAALAALDRLVKSDPRGQDVGGYAFDIARAFGGVNARELEKLYSQQVQEDNDPCWKGYRQLGMKKKGGKEVPNCIPEDVTEITLDEAEEIFGELAEDENLTEAEYQGRTVKLNKPMRGDVKKFKVYVKNEKGNVVKVNFGDPDMRIKKSNPARRKSFRARHNCDNPGPKTKARYWSCKKW